MSVPIGAAVHFVLAATWRPGAPGLAAHKAFRRLFRVSDLASIPRGVTST